MAKRLKIKPKVPGTVVRDPVTFLKLKDDGEEKNINSYWLRRMHDGSVVECKAVSTKVHSKSVEESE